MFVDQIEVEVSAGKGGDGIVAYRREWAVEKGGPFGGNGGAGGSVLFKAEEGLRTLLDFRFMKHIIAKDGERGKTKGAYGAKAKDTIIKVPVGTVIYDLDTNKIIADINKANMEVLICQGGRGGRGNMAFANGINKCPDFCEKGEPGEHKNIRLELKVLADCGLVGFPSVGKSTLISAVSEAKPKIASYHFTTLVPNLGMVEVGDGRSFVMADLPGLIEGASSGFGLGFQFLRHIERCRVIVHVIDIAKTEGRDPYDDYLKIRKELENYNLGLLERPEIIVCNKYDFPNVEKYFEDFKKHFSEDKIIIPVSAYTGYNTDLLCYKIADILDVTPKFELHDLTEEVVIYEYQEEKKMFDIRKENGIYYVTGAGLRRIFDMTDFNQQTSITRFARQLRFLGVDDELRKMGIRDGETVDVFGFEFEYYD